MPGAIDVLGIANVNASVTVSNSPADYRRWEYYHKALSIDNGTVPQYPEVTVSAVNGGSTSNLTGNVFVPKTPENFLYDADGNMTNDGRWEFTWDLPREIEQQAYGVGFDARTGECLKVCQTAAISHGVKKNRLIRLESLANAPSGSKRRLEFEYDWQGRRIKKKVTNLDTTQVILELKFLYDQWNLIAELNTDHQPLTTFLWGLDLSGTEQGAGGMGGLLAVNDTTNGAHFVCYDGNGNVAALLHAPSSALQAVYEYGPFGEPIRVTGPMGKANPIRFSTKYTDDESGFLYYGRRYYDPSTGRWLSRDPIEEKGGRNLYGFIRNSPLIRVDFLGLWATGVHSDLTESSFMDSINGLGIAVSEGCMSRMLGILQPANSGQDTWHSGALERHFNRPYVRAEGDEEQVTYRQQWRSNYDAYLAQEDRKFQWKLQPIFGRFVNCKGALKALGRLSHSWQDFFGHAIHESNGFSGSGGAFTASPEDPGEYWPSSYKLTAPWNPVSEHPPMSEPPFDSSEYTARRNSSIKYVKKQFDSYLKQWLSRCLCKCYEL